MTVCCIFLKTERCLTVAVCTVLECSSASSWGYAASFTVFLKIASSVYSVGFMYRKCWRWECFFVFRCQRTGCTESKGRNHTTYKRGAHQIGEWNIQNAEGKCLNLCFMRLASTNVYTLAYAFINVRDWDL